MMPPSAKLPDHRTERKQIFILAFRLRSVLWCGILISPERTHHPDLQRGHTMSTISISLSGLVVVETMPEHLRASHEAAGNAGHYPHNGAVREVMPAVDADSLIASGDEWATVRRDAVPSDADRYDYFDGGERIAAGSYVLVLA
jgi:hypothetical protein